MPRLLSCVLTSCFLSACAFDSTGKGNANVGGTGPGGDDGGTSADGTSGDGGGETDSSDDGGTSGTDGASGSGPCQGIVQEIVLVENATITPPMETSVSDMGEGTIASSPVAEQGTAVFPVDLPCSDTYHVWGRVNDFNPGTHGTGDPDSYYVTVDTGQQQTWFYGCGTFDAPQWSWQHVHHGEVGTDCDAGVELAIDLEAGVHTIVVRNREEAWFEQTAAIARILVTNDPVYVPTDE